MCVVRMSSVRPIEVMHIQPLYAALQQLEVAGVHTTGMPKEMTGQ